jgi:AMP deaminase
MCELARNSILQSGWELVIKKHWLGSLFVQRFLILGDDLETVANTNVPPGRLAFRREVLAEEQRLMMLSTRRSRSNTAESWFENLESSRPSSGNTLPNGTTNGLPPGVLGMFSGEKEGLEDVEERSEEGEDGERQIGLPQLLR